MAQTPTAPLAGASKTGSPNWAHTESNRPTATNQPVPTTLVGKTVRWTFTDGPTAGQQFEHTFNQDGSCEYRLLGSEGGEPTRVDDCACVRINDDVFAVSYCGESGYTLTGILDFATHRITCFASNATEWTQQKGTFQIVGGANAPRGNLGRGNRPAAKASGEEE